MTYTINQIKRIHTQVHAMAEGVAEPAPATRQRMDVVNDVLAKMLVFEKKTIDADELDPNVVTLIDYLLRQ